MASALDLKVDPIKNDKLDQRFVHVSNSDFLVLQRDEAASRPDVWINVLIKGFVYSCLPSEEVATGYVYLNMAQRQTLSAPYEKPVTVSALALGTSSSRNGGGDEKAAVKTATLQVGYFVSSEKQRRSLDCNKVAEYFKKNYVGHFVNCNQVFFFTLRIPDKVALRVTVESVVGSYKDDDRSGVLEQATQFVFVKAPHHQLDLENSNQPQELFADIELNFEQWGIGGLDAQFLEIFRRAFASRLFPPDYMKRLGLSHIKGILMHGPPGCGKTLIARQLCKALKAHEPKIVNGPEVLDRYVGGSEAKIRELFADAEAEYKDANDASKLHVIIFDEIDAVCKQRGTGNDSSGVRDSVVNQLLSKIDGVSSLNNILVIGMTNRPDLIDEALTRPGRLELKIEIGLPDEHGRSQILSIHTQKFKDSGIMDADPDAIKSLARRTKNFTGAEIAGMCRSAASFALNRLVDVQNPSKQPDVSKVKLTMSDFDAALKESKPAFGTQEDDLRRLYDMGIVAFNDEFTDAKSKLLTLARQVRDSERKGVVISVLLEGANGSGKTAVMANVALETGFPYVKLISPDTLVQQRESGKVATISQVFEDAYKTQLAMILIDDVERLLEYVNVNHRVQFSNTVMQALSILLKRRPPSHCRLLVIVATSVIDQMRMLQFSSVFYTVVSLPIVTEPEDFCCMLQSIAPAMNPDVVESISKSVKPMAVKNLLNAFETAYQDCGNNAAAITVASFLTAISIAE